MAFKTVTRRPRRPRPGAAFRTVVLAILGVCVLVPPAGAQTASLFISTSAGYDDNVLGRPGETSEMPSLNAGFLQIAPALAGSLDRGPLQVALGYSYLFNAYGSAEAGTYQNHLGRASVGWQPRSPFSLHLDGSMESFRRSEFSDFDLDRLEVAPRVRWLSRAAWMVEATLHAGRLRYPQRLLTSGTGTGGDIVQTDQPLDVDLSVLWRPDPVWSAALGGSRLHTGSNRADFRYNGWREWCRGESGAWLGLRLGMAVALEQREYEESPAVLKGLPPRMSLAVTRGSERQDHSTLVSLDASRRVSSRLDAFAEVSRLDYHSTADGYSFGETRLRTGIQWRIGSWGRSAAPAGPSVGAGAPPPATGDAATPARKPADLRPTIEGGSALFRCRAPGARRVSLVGDFNGWQPGGNSMTDPDEDGIWEVRIPLASGTYRYMFLVDDANWQRPEGAPLYEDDGFGMENGILVVP